MFCVAADFHQLSVKKKERRLSIGFRLKSSLDASAAVAEVGQVTEVSKDIFWPIVEAAGDETVVLDMHNQWCGPCKVIAPKFQELSQKYDDVVFLKLDCNQENKPLAKELGIKVVPESEVLSCCYAIPCPCCTNPLSWESQDRLLQLLVYASNPVLTPGLRLNKVVACAS